jgi:hypothetical protein
LVKRAGTNMRCTGKKYKKKDLWFDEECMEKNREIKQPLRKLKEKDDDESRTVTEQEVYFTGEGSRVLYKLITQKEVKKVWEAIRNITRRKEKLIAVEPHEWVSEFQELFSITVTGCRKES